jgi:suppressor of ftsI
MALALLQRLVALTALVVAVACADDAPTFSNPWSFSSANGALDLVLVDAVSNVTLAGQTFEARVWNGSFVGPTLRLWPGDVLRLTLVNNIGVPTNIHTHGLTVSPQAPSDDIFVEVQSGNTFTYRIDVPSDHPPGLFWYHSHAFADSEWQVFNGMAGAIVIEGLLGPFPQLAAIDEHILCLKDLQLVNGSIPASGMIDSNAPAMRLVNGLLQPVLTVRPGEMQLWRIANLAADIFFDISFDSAGLAAYRIAVDGQRQNQLMPMQSMVLGPSTRAEFLVVAANVTGQYNFSTMAFETGNGMGMGGMDGDSYPAALLAAVSIAGEPVAAPSLPTAGEFPVLLDYRTLPVANVRSFLFSGDDDGMQFYINGQQMQPSM